MAALLAGLADADLLSTQTLAECVTSGGDVLHRIADQAMAAAALTLRARGPTPTTQELWRFRTDPRSSG